MQVNGDRAHFDLTGFSDFYTTPTGLPMTGGSGGGRPVGRPGACPLVRPALPAARRRLLRRPVWLVAGGRGAAPPVSASGWSGYTRWMGTIKRRLPKKL